MINRLIKIADFLDRSGRQEDADFMTGLLIAYKKAQSGIDGINIESDYIPESLEIPDDEYDLLMDVFSSLGKSLNKDVK